ncbi:GPI mannosyltransferase 1 [Microbotryomycetes sp. JL201]|nr:GPI mannosyltransferase 1 [Microbotryomycetes sp. JL201]
MSVLYLLRFSSLLAGRVGRALALAASLRAVLVAWGAYQDATSAIKYTDIDYVVFTDAARCIVAPKTLGCSAARGPFASVANISLGDPYARDTYRYTPFLAVLMTPNVVLHESFGKILFAVADLVIGAMLYRLIRRRGIESARSSLIVSLCWTCNPVIANISTRGSAESVLGMLVVATLLFAERQRWDAAAVLFGAAVHFKIYPVIYGSSIMAALSSSSSQRTLFKPITVAHVRFGVISFASFGFLNLVAYFFWGWPFLEHTYLYHIHRLDHRHNFSPYFYAYYLGTEATPPLGIAARLARHSLTSFVPQMGLAIGSGFLYGTDDLAFAWFIQTALFVTFNKVCTSQYFLWYLWLLPPVIPCLEIRRNAAFTLAAVWVLGQAVWLSQAYRLEMKGVSAYRAVWFGSVAWFLSHSIVLIQLVRCRRSRKRSKIE